MRRALDSQILRFLFTGGLNTVFGYLVYVVGLWAHLAPEMALLIATVAGALFNYMTTARFVFRHRSLSRLGPFVCVYALVYVINAGAIRVVLSVGIAPAFAQALLVPFMAVLSFVLFRTLVFRAARPS